MAEVVAGKATSVIGVARLDCRHANARDEVAALLGGGHELTMLGIVAPSPEAKRADEHEEYAQPKQPPSPSAALLDQAFRGAFRSACRHPTRR